MHSKVLKITKKALQWESTPLSLVASATELGCIYHPLYYWNHMGGSDRLIYIIMPPKYQSKLSVFQQGEAAENGELLKKNKKRGGGFYQFQKIHFPPPAECAQTLSLTEK